MNLWLLFLIAAALGLRGAAAALRTAPARLPVRFAGWVLAGVAAWFAAGAAGAWSPLWPVLLAAVVVAVLDRSGRSFALWAGADALLVAGLGVLSLPMLPPGQIAVAALALAAVGFGLDLTFSRLPMTLRRLARWAAAPAVLGVGAFLVLAAAPSPRAPQPDSLGEALTLTSAVAPATLPGTERLTLPTGAVAWLDRPRGRGPFPGALFFHGAHPDGSHQPTAISARRALVAAGFVVLAVDHPGYGASPPPPAEGELADWDPLTTALAAFETLQSMPELRGITAVGHSGGNGEVLRLLKADAPLDAAVMLGAGLPHPEADPSYWTERFVQDRGIATPMDPTLVREIMVRFYDTERYATALPATHPPIHYVTFNVEWADLVETRDELYALLPGPKAAWQLDATHYLDTRGLRGLLVGDTRATRDLAARMQALVQAGGQVGTEVAHQPGPR